MDNLVTISNTKPNRLEFNADISGLDTKEMVVKFIIEANDMNIGFDATHIEGSRWEVNIPPLPMLERTAYPFNMVVISDGYHFKPLEGTVNIVGSSNIYVTTPAAIKPAEPQAAESEQTSESTKPKLIKKILTSVSNNTKNVSTLINEVAGIKVQPIQTLDVDRMVKKILQNNLSESLDHNPTINKLKRIN